MKRTQRENVFDNLEIKTDSKVHEVPESDSINRVLQEA